MDALNIAECIPGHVILYKPERSTVGEMSFLQREMEPKPMRLSAIEDLQTDTRKNDGREDQQTDTREINVIEVLQTDTRKNDGREDQQTDTREINVREIEPKPTRISTFVSLRSTSSRIIEDLQTDTRKNDEREDQQTDTREINREIEPKPTRISIFVSLRSTSSRIIEILQTDTRKNDGREDQQTDTRENYVREIEPKPTRISTFVSLRSTLSRIMEDLQTETRKNDGMEDLQTDTRKNDGFEFEVTRSNPIIISDASRNKKNANSKNLTVANQTTNVSSSCSRNGAKLMKSALILSLYLACASGADLEDGQHDQQAVFGIYPHTLGTVLHCPNISDYIRRASDKCAEVCGNYTKDGNCEYHCMRDSSKTSFVEFCARPKLLFDYCPVYDLLGRSIQIDISTLCNPSNHSHRYYKSSNIFFCDPEKCLQLPEAVVNTGVTHLMTEKPPINNGGINQAWLSQYWYMMLLLGLSVFSCFVLV